jgi:hypothetical protein
MAGPRRMTFKPTPGPSVLDHLPDLPRDHRRVLADVERHHQAAGEADPVRAHPRRRPSVERLRGVVWGDRLHVQDGRLHQRPQAAHAKPLVSWIGGHRTGRGRDGYQRYEICVAMTGLAESRFVPLT